MTGLRVVGGCVGVLNCMREERNNPSPVPQVKLRRHGPPCGSQSFENGKKFGIFLLQKNVYNNTLFPSGGYGSSEKNKSSAMYVLHLTCKRVPGCQERCYLLLPFSAVFLGISKLEHNNITNGHFVKSCSEAARLLER